MHQSVRASCAMAQNPCVCSIGILVVVIATTMSMRSGTAAHRVNNPTITNNVFTCNGGPHLQVHYDSRIQSITQSTWTVTNYTEIPSSNVTLP